ncbi:hypothetical protein HY947_04210 [Candidatus Gottesmanbacteria bacterium]|nr:hypothetical protein [Candidatus Gottesmanbacteria bacterium]
MDKQTFSQYFGLRKSQYELDFIDIPVNQGDIPLFIDPFEISKRNDQWSIQCHNIIVNYFQKVVDGIRANRSSDAKKLLEHLREPNQTRLGLSKSQIPHGRGIGGFQSIELFDALSESSAVKTGFINDLEDCELLIEGIGRDKISDIATNVIKIKLIEYTQTQCYLLDIQTHQVGSGFYWEPKEEKWVNRYVNLPVCHGRSIILIPKSIARYDLEFDYQEYYQHFVLNFLQTEELNANSSLVRTLKNGVKREPTKKSLKTKYPLTKGYLYEFSKTHPDVLTRYKSSKSYGLKELSNEAILQISEKQENFNIDDLISKLDSIPTGTEHANEFHDHVKGILTVIFHPYLINPEKERGTHDGRKRLDIIFTNAAREGFFLDLPQNKRIPSAYIMVECKNYSSDPANPELDQLAGRFSVNRGQFGLLICRKINNKDLFYKRCRDTAQDQRGYILPLDDDDIKQLLDYRKNSNMRQLNEFLDKKFKLLIL